MLIWSFFFLSKVVLNLKGHLQFDPFLNVLLALYAILPWAATRSVGLEIKPDNPLRTVHGVLGIPLSLMLLWHDSYFPPIKGLFHFLADPVTRPSNDYLIEFVMGYWNPMGLLLVAIIFAGCKVLTGKKINLAPGVGIVILFTAAYGAVGKSKIQAQAEIQNLALSVSASGPIPIEAQVKGGKPYDVVILQVCSMAWDDLKHAGMDQHPFFSQFDLLFNQFNTGTSYSTPAALRLLQGQCGQVSHQNLYQGVPEDCFLMENFRKIGYSTWTVFNHQGKLSEKMGNDISKFAKADLPMAFSDLAQEQINFDKSPVFRNFDVLEVWWKKRMASPSERAALFYNTVSLHGGSHFVNDPGKWWSRSRVESYSQRLKKTLEDFQKFFDLLSASGRDVLVVVVPEHGAALVGSEIQGADLRDIPLPKTTLVPMGIKLIGQGWMRSPKISIDTLVSYPVIARTLNLANSHHGAKTAFLESEFSDLPKIEYAAENESAATVIRNHELFYRGKEGGWKPLAEEHIPESLKTTLKRRSP